MTTPYLPHSHDGGLMKPIDHKPHTVPFTDIIVSERNRRTILATLTHSPVASWSSTFCTQSPFVLI